MSCLQPINDSDEELKAILFYEKWYAWRMKTIMNNDIYDDARIIIVSILLCDFTTTVRRLFVT